MSERQKKLDCAWAYNYDRLKKFVEKNKRLPKKNECEITFHTWIKNQIRRYKILTKDRKKLLVEINFNSLYGHRKSATTWVYMYDNIKKFITTKKRLPTLESDPADLRYWTKKQRKLQKDGNLSRNKKDMLEKLDYWYWSYNRWDNKYNTLMQFVEEKGRLPVTKDNGPLTSWLWKQQKKYNEGKLSADRLEKFNTLNTVLVDMHDYIWEEKYAELRKFTEIYNRLPNKHNKQDDLLEWMENIKEENLTDEQINELEQLPYWRWNHHRKRKRSEND